MPQLPMLISRLFFAAHPPTYRLYDRARQRLRPYWESTKQKHWRERKTAEYLLLSLTNCGRTWLRIMIGRALQQHYQLGDINLHDLFRFSEANPTLPSIKPMHEKYGQFGYLYELQKIILLVRDPRDAIVSRYHQHKAELGFDSLEAYVNNGPDLNAYIQFYNNWYTLQGSAQGLLVVRYEDMKQDTAREMQRVFEFLDLPITSAEIEEAIAYASFQKMRKMEVEGSSEVRAAVMTHRNVERPDSFKVRKGQVGGYRSELSDKTVAHIDTIVDSQLNPTYGYSTQAVSAAAEST